MLQNASLLAIVAVDTAENEPSEVGGASTKATAAEDGSAAAATADCGLERRVACARALLHNVPAGVRPAASHLRAEGVAHRARHHRVHAGARDHPLQPRRDPSLRVLLTSDVADDVRAAEAQRDEDEQQPVEAQPEERAEAEEEPDALRRRARRRRG